MTDYISIEKEKLYKLSAIEYLMLHGYNLPILSIDSNDFIFEDGSNFAVTYEKYGEEAFLYSLGEYLAFVNHLLRFEKTEPYDKRQFYFEKEDKETLQTYIERLIDNARYDLSCQPLGKIETSERDVWFTINAFDTFEEINKDIVKHFGEKNE